MLDRPTPRIMRALRSLLVAGKIEQQIGEDVKYRLTVLDPPKTAS